MRITVEKDGLVYSVVYNYGEGSYGFTYAVVDDFGNLVEVHRL